MTVPTINVRHDYKFRTTGDGVIISDCGCCPVGCPSDCFCCCFRLKITVSGFTGDCGTNINGEYIFQLNSSFPSTWNDCSYLLISAPDGSPIDGGTIVCSDALGFNGLWRLTLTDTAVLVASGTTTMERPSTESCVPMGTLSMTGEDTPSLSYNCVGQSGSAVIECDIPNFQGCDKARPVCGNCCSPENLRLNFSGITPCSCYLYFRGTTPGDEYCRFILVFLNNLTQGVDYIVPYLNCLGSATRYYLRLPNAITVRTYLVPGVGCESDPDPCAPGNLETEYVADAEITILAYGSFGCGNFNISIDTFPPGFQINLLNTGDFGPGYWEEITQADPFTCDAWPGAGLKLAQDGSATIEPYCD